MRRWLTLSLLSLSALSNATELPNMVTAGDTTQNSVVLWGRAGAPGNFRIDIATDPAFNSPVGGQTWPILNTMQPVKAKFNLPSANTTYYYRGTDASGAVSTGHFRTPPALGVRKGVRFGVTGDWRGELSPYPAVGNAAARNLDLFIELGDTIYADFPSPALPLPQALTVDDFRLKHDEVYGSRYGRNDLGAVRRSTSILATIDDHEVANDFAGGAPASSDPRFGGAGLINEHPLYRNGLQVFREFNPIEDTDYASADPRFNGRPKLYRARNWGSSASFFMLDARSFRDPGLPPANPLDPGSIFNYLVASFTPGRTMLGFAQVQELISDLAAAHAAGVTWKFIVVPEPIQNLGVLNASDRFEGYAAERSFILRDLKLRGIKNVVWISADIHGTLVNDLTFQNGPGQPQIPTGSFEITTGSVGFDAPFGPTVAEIAYQLGVPGALPPAVYNSLPLAQKEGYIQAIVNAQVTPLGYNPLGLANSGIPAALVQGSWTATNSYGWSEFEISPGTQVLTVTTWGIAPYTELELLANPGAITSRTPQVLQKFLVKPVR